MSTENERINELIENVRKRVHDKNKHKTEHLRQEQGNLMFDDETPETTVRKGRNSKPRGSKPKEQNLNNQQQQTISSNISIEEGLAKTRKEITDSKENHRQENEKNKKEKQEIEREERIKNLSEKANRLSKSISRTRRM